jgi:hypothetical protein
MKKGQRRKENAQKNRPRRKLRRNPAAFDRARASELPPFGWVPQFNIAAFLGLMARFMDIEPIQAPVDGEPIQAPVDVEVRELERMYKL